MQGQIERMLTNEGGKMDDGYSNKATSEFEEWINVRRFGGFISVGRRQEDRLYISLYIKCR